MFKFLKRLAVPLAADALFVFANPAKAVTVQYYTVGEFIANGTGATVVSTNLIPPFPVGGPLTTPYNGSASATIGNTKLTYNYSQLVTLGDADPSGETSA